MAGLLTHPFAAPSRPYLTDSGQDAAKHDAGFTAAGTVADLHGIPFSSPLFAIQQRNHSEAKVIINLSVD